MENKPTQQYQLHTIVDLTTSQGFATTKFTKNCSSRNIQFVDVNNPQSHPLQYKLYAHIRIIRM